MPDVTSTSPCILKSVESKNFQRFLVVLLSNCALLIVGLDSCVGSENIVAKRPGLASSNASATANGYVELYLNAFSTGAPSPNFHTPSIPILVEFVIDLTLLNAGAEESLAPAKVELSFPSTITLTLPLTPLPVITAVA